MTDTLVLRTARWKAALSVCCAVAFVSGGAFMAFGAISESARYPPEFIRMMGWVCMVSFGVAGLFALRNLANPTRVILTPEGFRVEGLRRGVLVPWRNVQGFFLAKVRTLTVVCYELAGRATPAQRALANGLADAWGDGQIPAHLTVGPQKMLALLEEWRSRHC